MRHYGMEVVLSEVPSEISLMFPIAGCKMGCIGCHWDHSTPSHDLDENTFVNHLTKNKGLATCVLFMGGEWEQETIVRFLDISINMGYETALYTGCQDVTNSIKSKLTYLKTGKWIEELGGLNSEKTNQKMVNLKTGIQYEYTDFINYFKN